MVAIFEGIVAIAKVFPIISDWLSQFFVWYAKTQIASMKQADKETVLKALLEQNQIPLEKLIGSQNAGTSTGLGSVVDTLPGVK